jgi:glycosyltransferase involved in cell wall biosynthesis
MPKLRLCVITTHPIQYMVPWLRSLASDPEIALHVIFFRIHRPEQQGFGFGVPFQWDIDLLGGYSYTQLASSSSFADLPRLSARLVRQLASCKPDFALITGWNEPGLILANLACKLMGIRVLIRGDSNNLRDRPPFVRLLHRALLSGIHGALSVGKANRDFYLAAGVPSERVFEGAHFVETERLLQQYREHADKKSALREEAGFAASDFVFCFVGKHVPFKRPEMLIEAAANLIKRGLRVKLLIAGAGQMTDQLKALANQLGVVARFPGFLNQSELWKAYLCADALVLPSTNGETWGLVTNEAMLFGLPVIVSDQVGCWRDLVRDGETGFVFSGGADGLADAMAKLAANKLDAERMGRNARSLVEEHYSPHNATHGLKKALRHGLKHA